MRGIDIHTHIVPESFPPYHGTDKSVPWPGMAPAGASHKHVMIAGSNFRTVSSKCWDVAQRLEDMDALGIQRQVLSPMPELLSYWLSVEDGCALSRYLNQYIGAMVKISPARFSGLGTVPLQDVDQAIEELKYVVEELGLDGVQIGTNVNGVPIGAPVLEPFFAEAERLGACIFVHPLRPCGMDRLVGPPALEQVLAFPCETGLAGMSLITGGVLSRHPDLRIALSHGGGSFPVLLARYSHAWKLFSNLREAVAENPLDLGRCLYFDSLVYDETLLRAQIRLFGARQTMIGSDYPFIIMESDPLGCLDELALSAKDTELLLCGNAMRWLGRDHG